MLMNLFFHELFILISVISFSINVSISGWSFICFMSKIFEKTEYKLLNLEI